MQSKDIVKLDRTTVQEFLPLLTQRGIFSQYDNLPKGEDILTNEKKRLGVDKLTLEQERAVLSKVGKYRSNGYVFRDYGDYVILFSAQLVLQNLIKTEKELKDKVLLEQYGEERITDALKKINTYKLAHKLAIIVLGEVYNQQKHEGIILPKSELVKALGYVSKDKHIYQDIREAMQSLRWLDYIIYNYKTKKKIKKDNTIIGNFIYTLSENSTEFKIWVNPLFVGCVIRMAEDNSKLSKEERKQIFERGYLEYPLDHIKTSKDISDAGYYLGHYLLTQKGNPKLNTKEYKVITVGYNKLLAESYIKDSNRNRRVNKMLKALEEITYIQQINPSLEELRQKSSKRVEEETVHIYIPQQMKKLS